MFWRIYGSAQLIWEEIEATYDSSFYVVYLKSFIITHTSAEICGFPAEVV